MLDPIIIVSALLKLGYALAAVVIVWWTVRFLRASTDRNVREALDRIDNEPVAAAIYLSVTFFGICYVVGRAIGCLLIAAFLSSILMTPTLAATFPAQYDRAIEQAASKWLPGVPWRILKAQYYQESRLDPKAVSPVGAAGVAQFMPATWAAIAPALGYGIADRRLAVPAIEGGAYYMAQLRRGWSVLPDVGRHNHAMASYNAGPGHIRKAWTACGSKPDWKATARCLPGVTGRYAAETITYVERIWHWYFAIL